MPTTPPALPAPTELPTQLPAREKAREEREEREAQENEAQHGAEAAEQAEAAEAAAQAELERPAECMFGGRPSACSGDAECNRQVLPELGLLEKEPLVPRLHPSPAQPERKRARAEEGMDEQEEEERALRWVQEGAPGSSAPRQHQEDGTGAPGHRAASRVPRLEEQEQCNAAVGKPLVTEAEGVRLRLSSSNISGYLGVYYKKTCKKTPWVASFRQDSTTEISLGTYATAVEAAVAASRYRDEIGGRIGGGAGGSGADRWEDRGTARGWSWSAWVPPAGGRPRKVLGSVAGPVPPAPAHLVWECVQVINEEGWQRLERGLTTSRGGQQQPVLQLNDKPAWLPPDRVPPSQPDPCMMTDSTTPGPTPSIPIFDALNCEHHPTDGT